MDTDDERIDLLETHLTFQDDTLRQLNDALVAQQRRIDQLEAELKQLIATVRNGMNDTRTQPADEIPPHY